MKPCERPKTEKNGEQWLPDHPWCPNGQIDYGISESEVKNPTSLVSLKKNPLNVSLY